MKGTGVPEAFPIRKSTRFCALESLIAELSVSLTFSLKEMVGFTDVEALFVLCDGRYEVVGAVVSGPPAGVASTVKLSKRLLPPLPPPVAENSTLI